MFSTALIKPNTVPEWLFIEYVLCALPILWLLGTRIYNLFFHKLASLPGPIAYRASGLPYVYKLITGQWPHTLKALHEEYGPIVRYSPNDVSFISAQAWNEIYGHGKPNKPTMSKDLRLYRETLTESKNILIANDADHSRMRRLLSHAFSEKALRGQEDILRSHIDKLISSLGTRADEQGETAVVDLCLWYNLLTFDVLGDLAFGEPFGCLDSGDYHPWVAIIFDGFKLSSYVQSLRRYPRAFHILKFLLPHDLIARQQVHQRQSFDKVKMRVELGAKPDDPNARKDFLSYVLRHNDERGMTADEMGENANILITAGSETTATALTATTYWLLRNPAVYQKLVNEIRSRFATEADIDAQSVCQIDYLLAALKEGLRMHPPVPSGLARQVPKGGASICDNWIAEDTKVSVSHYVAYSSTLNFTLPDQFIPERWLDTTPFANDATEVFQPFSYGPRNCIGMNLAHIEMRIALARVLWNYDLELQPASQSWHKQKIYIFWEKPALLVRVIRRKNLVQRTKTPSS
ncbi:hypothetical protein BELL_1022g00040 [Botrytis elliptica]|uniref:Uncharacterized protein n=1 Tax=Botrytis elliptica TaxID=278938 RepID=A0A4Z1IUI7_9HELO|nr:hypothetical protein BELL_1022g00040 [Botrytis elliptica]